MKFQTIRIEGAILTGDILDKLEQGDIRGQKASDFDFSDPSTPVKEEIVRAWADARDLWRMFQRRADTLRDNDSGTTLTRNQWIIPLLSLLGYSLEYQARGDVVNGKNYAISHRDTSRGNFPVHVMGFRDSLDRKREDSGPRMSPHALIQEYLNLTENLYAIVSNGQYLRLLRDSTRLVKLSYIEFNLDQMMDEQHFTDFAVMFRLLHASRMPADTDSGPESLIECYHQDALDSGSRIRDGLSHAVEESIVLFANGFLNHPANDALRQHIANGSLPAQTLYQWLLRLIYRLLFLMVIEERNLVYPHGIDPEKRRIYTDYYSVHRLRRLSACRHLMQSRYADYWQSLTRTFRLFEPGSTGAALGIQPLAGDLFNASALGQLMACSLDNATIMRCLKNLSYFTNPSNQQTVRINYAALNVEEFGSVYEGLLEFDPSVTQVNDRWSFQFVSGSERAASGTHYTPDELVLPLIKHSLDHVIREKLERAGEIASREVGSGEVGNDYLSVVKEVAYEWYQKNHIVQGFAGMAERDGLGSGMLSGNEGISGEGNVRVGESNPSGGQFSSSEHRGRMGPGNDWRLHSISQDSSGQPERTGNTYNSESATGLSSKRDSDASIVTNGISRQNAPLSHTHSSKENLTSPPTGHSPLPTGHSPLPTDHSLSLKYFFSTPFPFRNSLLAQKLLLSIKVCDPACGSGHILLNAARRIATELAYVRTGEEQPSPTVFRAAVRDVIRNCIYGVDINPLAVELCKVALWLEAHNPGEPLNFLDHHIKCGDAIVGLATLDELEKGIPVEAFKKVDGDDTAVAASLRKTNNADLKHRTEQFLNFGVDISHTLARALERLQMVTAMPETTPGEIAAKKSAYEAFVISTERHHLNVLADLQVAQFFIPKTEANRRRVTTDSMYQEFLRGMKPLQGEAVAMAMATANERRFFHWFLEFPDVFARDGFDCVLGNPPFLGGQKLSGTFGKAYPQYLKYQYSPIGSCDLVTYFFRRVFSVIKEGGFQSLLATNTIAQGGAREGGLAVIQDSGGTINHAVRSMPWPGLAAVEVALVTIFKGDWQHAFMLNRKNVERITSYLDDDEDLGEPYRLKANEGKSFQGSIVLGKGFVLTPEEAQGLIDKDPRNRDVLYPYLNGDDVNSRPDQSPSRWVINFHDWPLDREWDNRQRHPKGPPYAADYPDCLEIVRRLVKPERDKNKRKVRKEQWWKFAEQAKKLYRAIEGMERVLVIPEVTKYCVFSFSSTSIVFMHTLKILTSSNKEAHTVLNSSFHVEWAWKYSSTMGGAGLRYILNASFETFPFPQVHESSVVVIGESFYSYRTQLMQNYQLGLTKLYNQFNNAALGIKPFDCSELSHREIEKSHGKQTLNLWRHLERIEKTDSFQVFIDGIVKLRQLQKEMDNAVLSAYGWHIDSDAGPAIDLAHGFYEVEYLPETDRVRYTISPAARKEVLKRLLLLNHERYAGEMASGE